MGGDFGDMVVDIRVDAARAPHAELRRILDLRRSGDMLSEAGRLLNAGNVEGARERAEAARDLSPEHDRAWTTLARVPLAAGRRAEAVAALKEAVALQPRIRTSLASDPAYEPLRADAGFQTLVRP